MKVLFVLSGNHLISNSIIENQARSIIDADKTIAIEYYYVKGKGISGYMKNILPLRKKIAAFKPDIMHAHYSFCGFLAVLALTRVPIVTSLMGSDTQFSGIVFKLLKFFSKFWKHIIIKSEIIKTTKFKPPYSIIPNGVNLNTFIYEDKTEARKILNLDPAKTYILFLANPERKEKNYELAQQAVSLLGRKDIELLTVYNQEHAKIKYYLYASDILILTSRYEGSPNAVKEAMACNLPAVSTHVGDVKWLFENTTGYFIAQSEPKDFSEKIRSALNYSNSNEVNGRKKLGTLHLDSESVAKNIISIYRGLIK